VTSAINLPRLAIAIVVLAALFVPLYFLALGDEAGDPSVTPATLRQTPASASASRAGPEIGQLAPDFEISTTDGRRVRLSDFRGRPVVLNFFALWCTSCLTEMPQLKAAQEERGIDAFAVLAINAGETRERALEFVDFLNAPFTYGLDTSLVVSDAYRVYGLPSTVFIDATGVIQTVYAGSTDKERLDTFLDAAINAQPPGDLPVVLRLISTIPRDRVLRVEAAGARELKLTSRSLRCDAGYCAEPVVTALKAFAGVSNVKADLADPEPSITLRFDPGVITRRQLIDATVQALDVLEDPVYQGPIQIQEADS
jgi:peroxiredoxin/copper chaperone CopZ